MSRIVPLLQQMRGRLGMYVGSTSIVKLAAFLRGYEHAATKLAGAAPDPFLPAFRDWIHERYQSSARSWEETILASSRDETDAVERFWQLFDEFQQRERAATNGAPPAAKPTPVTRPA
jgi:hypothetical protein